jgi:hypothetical protein
MHTIILSASSSEEAKQFVSLLPSYGSKLEKSHDDTGNLAVRKCIEFGALKEAASIVGARRALKFQISRTVMHELLSAFAKEKKGAAALKLYEVMLAMGYKADSQTLLRLVSSFLPPLSPADARSALARSGDMLRAVDIAGHLIVQPPPPPRPILPPMTPQKCGVAVEQPAVNILLGESVRLGNIKTYAAAVKLFQVPPPPLSHQAVLTRTDSKFENGAVNIVHPRGGWRHRQRPDGAGLPPRRQRR